MKKMCIFASELHPDISTNYITMKLLKSIGAAVLLACLTTNVQAQDYTKYYQNLPVALQQVKAPAIPDNTITLTEEGGVGNGVTQKPSRKASANSRSSVEAT